MAKKINVIRGSPRPKKSIQSVPVKQSVTPVHKDRKKIIAIVSFTVVVLILFSLLAIFGKQFVGQAIKSEATILKVGEAGIPLTADSTMDLETSTVFDVHANLGKQKGYEFQFELSYRPGYLEYLNVIENPGISILDVEDTGDSGQKKLVVTGMSTTINDKNELSSLNELTQNDKPLVRLKFKAVKKGGTTLTFNKFLIFNRNDKNIITAFKDAKFKIVETEDVSPVVDCITMNDVFDYIAKFYDPINKDITLNDVFNVINEYYTEGC